MASQHGSTTFPSIQTTRGGFDETDFSGIDLTLSSSPSVVIQINNSRVPDPLQCLTQQTDRGLLYRVLDSTPISVLLALVMLVDAAVCSLAFLRFLQSAYTQTLENVYRVLDFITAAVFLLEINIRLYCYGLAFYFHSALRYSEYFVSTANAIFVFCTLFSKARWLLFVRLPRLLRLATFIMAWRERNLKWKAREQLQVVAEALENDPSHQHPVGLTKWRIPSEHVAIGERAGHGAFGTVFSALFRGTLVAVKQIPAVEREESMANIEEEAVTLVNLRHPNVVLFMGFACEPSRLWIVTEYCSRGSLRDVLDDPNVHLSEGRILKLALGAARGLAYLHGQDPPVLHLDLKASNILISSGWEAKLGDFGLSRNVTNIQRDCFPGTMQYTAPEVLKANEFSTAADIYSFGICLWELAVGDIPFKNKSPTSVLWGVVKEELRPPLESLHIRDGDCFKDFSSDKALGCDDIRITQRISQGGRQAEFIAQALKCTRSGDADVEGTADFWKEKVPGVYHGILCAKTQLSTATMSKSPENALEEPPKIYPHQQECPAKGVGSFSSDSPKWGLQFGAPTDVRRTEELPLEEKGLQPDRTSGQKDTAGPTGFPMHDLSLRVTATMQQFDDRPPVARQKEGGNRSKSNATAHCAIENDEIGPSSKPRKMPQRLRSMLRPKILSPNQEDEVQQQSNQKYLFGSAKEDTNAFTRRLANFSEAQPGSEPPVRAVGNRREEALPSETPLGAGVKGTRATAVPSQYVELIRKCWAQDPSQRPSASEVVWMIMLLINGEL